jgi:hypothetical protein
MEGPDAMAGKQPARRTRSATAKKNPAPAVIKAQPLYDYYIDGAQPAQRDLKSSSAFATFYWWCWRRRVELAPWAAGAGVLVGSTILFKAGTPMWAPVTMGAGNAALWFWAPRKWDREIERKYAKAVAAAAGAWSTVAAFVGPGYIMLILLLIGVIVGGTPWWKHKLARPADLDTDSAKLLAEWQAKWVAIRDRLNLPNSRVIKADGDPGYVELTIQLVPGVQNPDQLQQVRGLIAGALRMGDATIRTERVKADASLVKLIVRTVTAIDDTVEWDDAMTPPSVNEPITFGRLENGQPHTHNLFEGRRAHMWLTGVTRSGKSTMLNAIMAALTACPDTVVFFIDFKGGRAARAWLPSVDWLATDIDEALLMMEDVDAMIKARAIGGGSDDEQIAVTQAEPAVFVVFDEASAGLADDTSEDAAKVRRLRQLYISLSQRGAGLGIISILATQYSAQYASTGDARISKQHLTRFCFQQDQASDVANVLPDWERLDTSKLDKQGMYFFSTGPDGTSAPARGVYVSSEQAAAMGKQNAARRGHLERRSLDATRSYADRWSRLPAALRRFAAPAQLGTTQTQQPNPAHRPTESAAATTPEDKTMTFQSPGAQRAAAALAEMEAQFPDTIPVTVAEHFAAVTPQRVEEELDSGAARFAAAFANASASGIDRKTLVGFVDMSSSWTDERVKALTDRGTLERVGHGRYRAVDGADVRAALDEYAEERRRVLA